MANSSRRHEALSATMRLVPVEMAKALRAEGMAWRDVVQEIAWASGRRFTADAVAAACRRPQPEAEAA